MKQWIINYYDTGDMITYLNGKVHSRHGSPAIITNNGYSMWFEEGLLHRENAPAFVNYNTGIHEWWTHGVKVGNNDRYAEVSRRDF